MATATPTASTPSDLTSIECERIAESMGFGTYTGRSDGLSVLYVGRWQVLVGADEQDNGTPGIAWQAASTATSDHDSGAWDSADDVRSTLRDLAA